MEPSIVSDGKMESFIKTLECGERRLTLSELRAIKKWREGTRKGVSVALQNGEPVLLIDG